MKKMKNPTLLIILGILLCSCNKKTPVEDASMEEPLRIKQEKPASADSGPGSGGNNEALVNELLNNRVGYDTIAGYYVDDEAPDTIIALQIIHQNNAYRYELNTGKRILRGAVSFSTQGRANYIVLEGIPWASWRIDGKDQELPKRVGVLVGENIAVIETLTIQNQGNEKNNFVIFDEIGKKYIALRRIDEK